MSAHIDDRKGAAPSMTIAFVRMPDGSIRYQYSFAGLTLAEAVFAMESCKLRMLGVGGGSGSGGTVPGLNPRHA